MASLRHQVCHNHAGREAIARCPSCGFYFCRECITEHDDRVLCASCLKKLTAPVERPRRNFAPLIRGTAAFCGLLVAWIFFYLAGRVLLATPTKFHEATLWREELENERGNEPP
jgi:hypothetical protein